MVARVGGTDARRESESREAWAVKAVKAGVGEDVVGAVEEGRERR